MKKLALRHSSQAPLSRTGVETSRTNRWPKEAVDIKRGWYERTCFGRRLTVLIIPSFGQSCRGAAGPILSVPIFPVGGFRMLRPWKISSIAGKLRVLQKTSKFCSHPPHTLSGLGVRRTWNAIASSQDSSAASWLNSPYWGRLQREQPRARFSERP